MQYGKMVRKCMKTYYICKNCSGVNNRRKDKEKI